MSDERTSFGSDRTVTCAKGHTFTTNTERSWNGLYCPAATFGRQCQEPLRDPKRTDA
jgi:hypothetical protein